ncbi:MAG: Wzz/FepE/Etk N-terminal domain-containing protein [Chloroflexales bacterium]|nr:Wzz/FepE/Etk N-terminal domain-containing protein [Chloroflexales bacterium]
MQLRHYFTILRRFWILIVILPLVVGIASLYVTLNQPARYSATARLMVSQEPQVAPRHPYSFPDFNLYNSWESSAYILDDLPQVVTSAAFGQDVSAWLQDQGYDVAPNLIQAGVRAEIFHRSVSVSANSDTPELAQIMLRGAVETLQSNGLKYWGRATNGDSGLSVAILDPPGNARPLSSLRTMVVDVGLRVGLALATAIGLAFLLHYLDDIVRGPQQAEDWTGIRVLGVIPKE